jgi:cell division protein FtsW
MVLSASSVRSYEDFGSSYTVFIKQVTWVGLGLPVVLVASRMSVRSYRRLAYPILALALVLLIAVLIPPFGDVRGGARRWIAIGSYTIQPSEFAKLALVLWGADLLVRKRRLLTDAKHLLVPLVPVALLIFLLIMLEPDMGTTLVVLAILITLLWVVGTPIKVFLTFLGAIALLGTALVITEPYRFERLLSFRDPFADEFHTGFQAVQGLYALSSGGWWGEGLGASREKWPGLLPAAHTDFILAIIGEELGLPGSIGVVLLFGVLGYAGIRIAHLTDDGFVRLAASASAGWVFAQGMVNMAAVVGLLPITGIPLPLVSFGGSSLILTMVTIGMLLSFARSEPAAAQLLAERARKRRSGRRRRHRWITSRRKSRRESSRELTRDAAASGPTPSLEGDIYITESAWRSRSYTD